MAAVAEGVEAESGGEAGEPQRRSSASPGEPDAVDGRGPEHAEDDGDGRLNACCGDVGEHAQTAQPRRGRDHERDEHDEQLLPRERHGPQDDAGVREEFVEVVPVEDEEADGDEVDEHERADDDSDEHLGVRGQRAVDEPPHEAGAEEVDVDADEHQPKRPREHDDLHTRTSI